MLDFLSYLLSSSCFSYNRLPGPSNPSVHKMLPALVALLWLLYGEGAFCWVDCNFTGAYIELNDTSDNLAASACGQINTDLFIGSTQTGAVSLDGLQIAGANLSGGGLHAITVPGMTCLSSDTLTLAGAWIEIRNHSFLTSLAFPNLTNIGLALNLQDLPLLNDLQLADGVNVGYFRRSVGSFSGALIRTGLTNFEKVFNGTPSDITITQNPNLISVSLWPTEILLQYNSSGGTGNLKITENGPSVNVDLPYLSSTAGSIILSETSELNIPVLTNINGSLTIDNATFSDLTAPALQTINGDLKISGNFSSLRFPVLKFVQGDIELESPNYTDCTRFEELYSLGSILGTCSCKGSGTSSWNSTGLSGVSGTSGISETSGTPKTSATSWSKAVAGSSTDKLAKAGIAVGSVVGGFALIGGTVFLYLWYRRYKSAEAAEKQWSKGRPSSNMTHNLHHFFQELPPPTKAHRSELGGDYCPPELPGEGQSSYSPQSSSVPTAGPYHEMPQRMN